MGTELSPEALRVFVQDLAQLDDHEILYALLRTRRECTRLTLAEVLKRAGMITEAERDQIDAVRAWDQVVEIVDKFGWYNSDGDVVLRPSYGTPKKDCANCRGRGWTMVWLKNERHVGKCDCRQRDPVPELDRRTEDTVRRCGGWTLLKDLAAERHNFVRREFLREFVEWRAIESLPASGGGGELIAVSKLADNSEALLDQILRSSDKKPSASAR